MVKYFIANPTANELIAFPDGKAFLTDTTSKHDAVNYGRETKQESKIVKREDFKNEIEAELKRIEAEKNGVSVEDSVEEPKQTKKTQTKK